MLLAFIPLAQELPSLATVAGVTALLWTLIVLETIGFGELWSRLRRRGGEEPSWS